MHKAILSAVVAFLTLLGCLYLYQRETMILNNQAAFSGYIQQNEAWKQQATQAINSILQKQIPNPQDIRTE